MGCVTQIGEQGWNIGRMVTMVAGWPRRSAATVDRQCGSSLQTNFNAAAAIWSGQLDVVISAGVEMMSRADGLERRRPLGQAARALADRAAGDLRRGGRGRVGPLARRGDAYSLESHRRGSRRSTTAASSRRSSRSRWGPPGPPSSSRSTRRRGATRPPRSSRRSNPPSCRTASSPPATRARSSTARPPCWSRASGRPRGSAWSRARFVSFGLSGVDPYRMLHGNPEACRKALEKAGLTWDDISVVEVNEAFASVVLQFAHDAGLEDRFADINPNGGGISLGHPLRPPAPASRRRC